MIRVCIYVEEEEKKSVKVKMRYHYVLMKLVLALYVSWVVSLCHAQPFKAVNLGNWLVAEGWMKPDRFDGIPNNDLLVNTPTPLINCIICSSSFS